MADERNDQTVSDEYPEIVVNEEEGTVTLKGEQQPEVKPVEPTQLEPEAGKESGVTPEAEQPPELNPIEQEFVQAGLDRQFRGGVSEMIKTFPEFNRAYTQTRQELAEARRQMYEMQQKSLSPPAPEPTIDINEFAENPAKVLDTYIERKLAAQKADVDKKFDLMEAQSFVKSKPDFASLIPIMDEVWMANPALGKLTEKELVPILYDMAKAKQIPAIVKDTANKAKAPAPPDKALGEAGTKGVSKPKVMGEKTREQWAAMTPEQIEKEIGVVDT